MQNKDVNGLEPCKAKAELWGNKENMNQIAETSHEVYNVAKIDDSEP